MAATPLLQPVLAVAEKRTVEDTVAPLEGALTDTVAKAGNENARASIK